MTQEHKIQEGFSVIKIENTTNTILKHSKDVSNNFIQLHFCLNEDAQLHYGPHYSLDVKSQKSVLLYNPNQNLPINLSLNAKGKYLIFVVTIKLFHSFFSQVSDLIPFLNDENKDKKYYLDKDLSPSEILILNQIIDEQKQTSMQNLYIKAKAYEVLSFYFGKTQDNKQSCPFLDSEDNVDKIKKAKQIII